jgi:4-hydroxy-3-polyprenylbenzoate decarboxylase
MSRKIIVAMTGATGAILGGRMIEAMREAGVETHLVMSKWAGRTLVHETPYTVEQVEAMATHSYQLGDQGAAISSGSFVTDGMVVIPCSMRTLASIAHGTGDNLIHRSADVTLKERRKMVLVVRESPLSDIHLENMLKLSRMGVVMIPPMPAFYNHPKSLDDMINHIVMRTLDQFGIHLDLLGRWTGAMRTYEDQLLKQQSWPSWWHWELELSPHLLKRMDDRRFTEVDLRYMLERARDLAPDVVPGRWIAFCRHRRRAWEAILEPDFEQELLVVVTAYEVYEAK